MLCPVPDWTGGQPNGHGVPLQEVKKRENSLPAGEIPLDWIQTVGILDPEVITKNRMKERADIPVCSVESSGVWAFFLKGWSLFFLKDKPFNTSFENLEVLLD